MAFDFPAIPGPGDTFSPPGGPIYQYNGEGWDVVEGTVGDASSYWVARTDLAADVAAGMTIYPGKTYPAGGQLYVGASGATAIPDLPGLLPLGTVTPYHFGGVGDAVADDAAAINAAILFCYSRAQSGVVDMAGGRWLVNSANILVKHGVQLVGSWNNVGEVAGGTYLNLRSSIILNPSYTINLAEDFSGIKGMVVLNKNLQQPTTARQMQDMVNDFAGTAITVGVRAGVSGAANDSYVGYCFVLGFEYAYWSDLNERVTIEYLRGDNTNGVRIARCYDMNHMSHCHMWGYLAAHLNLGTYFWSVAGAADSGTGLVRLTLPANTLVTGDIITVTGVTGTIEANGRWTVTVIDPTHVDLVGSAFVNAYVSGGTLYMHYSVRHGTAYNFADDVDWGQADNCFSWGYDIGFNIESLAHAELVNCGTDHTASIGDPTTIGFRLKDVDSVKLIGCKSAATAYGIWADFGNSGGGAPVMVTGHDFWGLGICGLKQVSGRTNLTASSAFMAKPIIDIDPTSHGVHAVGNRQVGAATPVVCPAGPGQRLSHFVHNSWADPSAMGNQQVFGNTQRAYKWDAYDDTAWTMFLTMRKARGSAIAPAAAQAGDQSVSLSGMYWDGVDSFRYAGTYRLEALSTTTPTSVPGRHVWTTVNTGSVNLVDSLILQYGSLYPANGIFQLGAPTARWTGIYGQALNLETSGNPDVVMGSTGAASTMNVWFRRGSPTPLTRWTIGMGNQAESGGNTGSNFGIGRFSDDGLSNLGGMSMDRATGATAFTGSMRVLNGSAPAAGGVAGIGYMMSSTVNLGIFFGSGAPTLQAAKGSFYLNTTGSSSSTRLYVNTDGATAWTPVTTAT